MASVMGPDGQVFRSDEKKMRPGGSVRSHRWGRARAGGLGLFDLGIRFNSLPGRLHQPVFFSIQPRLFRWQWGPWVGPPGWIGGSLRASPPGAESPGMRLGTPFSFGAVVQAVAAK